MCWNLTYNLTGDKCFYYLSMKVEYNLIKYWKICFNLIILKKCLLALLVVCYMHSETCSYSLQ